MLKKRLTALALSGLLTTIAGTAMAGSTGPTDPEDNAPKVPLNKNTDGTSPGAKGTSPGVKGMDHEPGQKSMDGDTGNGGGMSNEQGMGGSGGGGEGGGSGDGK
ncbi:hypothetical protein [Pseudomonas sp. DWP3-1-2]|uniref:hypothetical protein n=1 Tax=Pseudomonas sp. DWP3-1-2 TaxID=2804645 RepID=UPI003CF173CC